MPTYPPGANAATIRGVNNLYAMNKQAKEHDKACDEVLITIFKRSIEPEFIEEIEADLAANLDTTFLAMFD